MPKLFLVEVGKMGSNLNVCFVLCFRDVLSFPRSYHVDSSWRDLEQMNVFCVGPG